MKPWYRAGMWVLVVAALLSLTWLAQRGRAIAGPALDPSAAGAQAAAVLVSLYSPGQAAALGDQFTIAVQISGLASPLSAFQFDLGYDPALIQPAGVTPGAFLSSTGRNILCPNPVYPTPSTMRLACVGAGEAPGPIGSGTLVLLKFTAMQVGTGQLTLSALQLPGGGTPPVPIPATMQGGQVTVVPAPGYIYLPLIFKAH